MDAQADHPGPHTGMRPRQSLTSGQDASQGYKHFKEQVETHVIQLINSSAIEPCDPTPTQEAICCVAQALYARIIQKRRPLRLHDFCTAIKNLELLRNSALPNAGPSRIRSNMPRSPYPLTETSPGVPTTSTPSSTLSSAASVHANDAEGDIAVYKREIEQWDFVLDTYKPIKKAWQAKRNAELELAFQDENERSTTLRKLEVNLEDKVGTFLLKLGAYRANFQGHFKTLEYLRYEDTDQRARCKAAICRFFDDSTFEATADCQALAELIRSLPLDPVLPPAAKDPEEDPLRDLLATNIRRNYRGNAPLRLLNFAIKVNRIFFHEKAQGQRPYIKGTPIVQSSGTGKTRMVLELGRIAPLLFVCIRPQHTHTARSGYPLGDVPVVEFVFQECSKSKAGYNEQAAALLAAWFDTLASKLRLRSTPAQKAHLLTELNDYGGVQHASDREEFFKDVKNKAIKLLNAAPTPGADSKAIFDRQLNAPVSALSKQLEQVREHMATVNPRARSAPVFVAIDECVTLPAELLVSIRRAWNHIGQLEPKKTRRGAGTVPPFWLILMSTSSGASTLVRPQQEQPSNRDKNAVALPTFVGVGFDVLRTEQPPLEKARGVGEFNYIKYYGRPLWVALLDANLWDTAMLKLTGPQKFQRGISVTSFNILASRLALRFVPVRGADGSLFGEQLSFSHQGVDRHARILAKVESDSALHIRSPSEPVLAIAASLVMMPTPGAVRNDGGYGNQADNRYGSILATLKDHCLASANIDILKGTRGELMARLLLMTAWDAAKVVEADWFFETEEYDKKAAHLLKPVSLGAILKGLVQLDRDSARKVQKRIHTVCSLVAQKQFTGSGRGGKSNVQAWTHFTHFDILESRIEEISTEYLWYCWKRGVGIQMAHPQHGIDGIIPVFVGDLERSLVNENDQESNPSRSTQKGKGKSTAPRDFRGEILAARQMTYVAWEAKNRKEAGPKLADAAAGKTAHAGPRLKHATGEASDLSQRGILTILADMGVALSHAPRVKNIKGADSLQVWIRGLDFATNYPCLSTLNIRNVALSFLRTVSEHMDYDKDNMIPDPMSLRLAQLKVVEGEDEKNEKGEGGQDQIEEEDVEGMMDSSDEMNVMDDNLLADESLSSPIPAAALASVEDTEMGDLAD